MNGADVLTEFLWLALRLMGQLLREFGLFLLTLLAGVFAVSLMFVLTRRIVKQISDRHRLKRYLDDLGIRRVR